MFKIASRRHWLLLSPALFVMGSLTGCPAKEPPNACSLDAARCERLCAGCDDVDACMKGGGECPALGGQLVKYDDAGDGGDDVFHGGCHYRYTDQACTQGKTFVDGDSCHQNTIFEWKTDACHTVCTDTRDCDAECKKLNLGGGTCEVLADHCGEGQNSARCKCENGQPPDNPT